MNDEHRLLERFYQRILGRSPRPDEVEPSLELIHEALSGSAGAQQPSESAAKAKTIVQAWAVLVHALFCSTGFQYLD